MQGAREYATIFSSGQHGRLYLVCGEHARGKTFHILVLPSVDPTIRLPWTVKDAVEVYGVTGGQPGWKETYGWLHHGKWEQDFAALVEARHAEIETHQRHVAHATADGEARQAKRTAALLAAY